MADGELRMPGRITGPWNRRYLKQPPEDTARRGIRSSSPKMVGG